MEVKSSLLYSISQESSSLDVATMGRYPLWHDRDRDGTDDAREHLRLVVVALRTSGGGIDLSQA
jgi:hypothetical protein